MTRAIPSGLVLACALICVPAPGAAQVQAPGAPSEGVTVQHRIRNPGDSQQILGVQSPAAAPVAGDRREGGAQLEDPAAGPQPFTNHMILGLTGSTSQGPVWLSSEEIYYGVIPGYHNTLPHIARSQARGQRDGRPNTLTWLGFQPFEDSTRVFIQTGRPAQYQVRESPDGLTIMVRLRDTRIELSNFRRLVDASFFGRAVSQIDAAGVGDGVTEVTIALTRSTDYVVESEGEYIYIDFAD